MNRFMRPQIAKKISLAINYVDLFNEGKEAVQQLLEKWHGGGDTVNKAINDLKQDSSNMGAVTMLDAMKSSGGGKVNRFLNEALQKSGDALIDFTPEQVEQALSEATTSPLLSKIFKSDKIRNILSQELKFNITSLDAYGNIVPQEVTKTFAEIVNNPEEVKNMLKTYDDAIEHFQQQIPYAPAGSQQTIQNNINSLTTAKQALIDDLNAKSAAISDQLGGVFTNARMKQYIITSCKYLFKAALISPFLLGILRVNDLNPTVTNNTTSLAPQIPAPTSTPPAQMSFNKGDYSVNNDPVFKQLGIGDSLSQIAATNKYFKKAQLNTPIDTSITPNTVDSPDGATMDQILQPQTKSALSSTVSSSNTQTIMNAIAIVMRNHQNIINQETLSDLQNTLSNLFPGAIQAMQNDPTIQEILKS